MSQPKQRLADFARETTNKANYAGHQSKQEQWRAQHQAEIDKARSNLKETVMKAAEQGRDSVTLFQLGHPCVEGEERNRGDYYSNKTLKCEQCIEFKKSLEDEGFTVSLGEDKYFFLFDISWKEST